jgi:hypothetical protein
MNSTIRLVSLNAINADNRLQMRVSLNQDHVDDIAEALTNGELLDPPPIVFQDGEDCWLADGFHRFAAHDKIGLPAMRCEVREGTFRDALRFALGANQHTSLKRTNADNRKAVEMALADDEIVLLSNVQIAELCGVGQALVRDVRELSSSRSAKLTHRVGRNGRTIDTANIGRSTPRLADGGQVAESTPRLESSPAKTDPFGHPLGGELVQVFEQRQTILSMIAEMEEVRGRIKQLHDQRGGRFLPVPALDYHLANAQKLLEAASPQTVCPECSNADPKRQAMCRTCDGAGFVSAGKFGQLALVLQQRAKNAV